MQADTGFRNGPESLAHFYTPSPNATDARTGTPEMVPLSNVVNSHCEVAPPSLTRYNGYAAVEIVGNQAPGHSSGEAMEAMQRIVEEDLPEGFGYDWNGQYFQEILDRKSTRLNSSHYCE